MHGAAAERAPLDVQISKAAESAAVAERAFERAMRDAPHANRADKSFISVQLLTALTRYTEARASLHVLLGQQVENGAEAL